MTTVQPPLPEQVQPAPQRASLVVMGRQDSLSAIMRLIVMELDKLRSRVMARVLLGAGLLFMIAILAQVGISLAVTVNSPVGDFIPPLCSANPNADYCVNHLPTQADMAQYKHLQIQKAAQNLLLPDGLQFVEESIVLNIMSVLVVIVVGTMVGGDYSLGTVRLLFTRGPTRLQFLFAKIATAIICIVPMALVFTIVGVLVGSVLAPLSGVSANYSFLSAGWIGHALLYLLFEMFAWFVFGMVTLFCGIVGRSSVAGVVGGLVWYVVETGVSDIIHTFTNKTSGPFVDFLQAIPQYFVGDNTFALLKNQGTILFHEKPPLITDLHASLVLAAYLIVFIGLSCWITVRRDVTN